MEIFFVLVVVVAIIWWFRRYSKPAAKSGRSTKTKGAASGRKPYATLLNGGSYKLVSREEVRVMFAPFREKLAIHKAEAKMLSELVEWTSKTGKLDEDALNPFATADLRVASTYDAAKTLFDRLSFEAESASERWEKIVKDLYSAQADIEEALSSFRVARQMAPDDDQV